MMASDMRNAIVFRVLFSQFRPAPQPCQTWTVVKMNHPPIRSYVLRQGRFSPGQQRAYAELLPRFGIAYAPHPIDYAQVFGRRAPVVAEIGFGMGETTARIAAENPRNDYLAIEVHSPGVGSLLKQVG